MFLKLYKVKCPRNRFYAKFGLSIIKIGLTNKKNIEYNKC